MASISGGGAYITPLLSLIYDTDRFSRNIVHTILGRAESDITIKPASLRVGELSFLFADRLGARRAEEQHATPGVFILLDLDVQGTTMYYVTTGSIRTTLDPETRTRWIVTVEYQEVEP